MKISAQPPSSFPDQLLDIAKGDTCYHPRFEYPLLVVLPATAALSSVCCVCLHSGHEYMLDKRDAVCARALAVQEDPNP